MNSLITGRETFTPAFIWSGSTTPFTPSARYASPWVTKFAKLRVKYDHLDPRKPQHSPYKHAPIIYGPKVQYATEDGNIPLLDADGILCVKSIVGVLLFYGRAVDNNILVSLSELGQQQAADTQATNNTILQPLDYVATYPSNGINFRSREIILSSHSDAAYLNVTKARTRAGAQIMLSENVLVPA